MPRLSWSSFLAVAEPEKKDILLINSRNQTSDAGDMNGERRRGAKEDGGGDELRLKAAGGGGAYGARMRLLTGKK